MTTTMAHGVNLGPTGYSRSPRPYADLMRLAHPWSGGGCSPRRSDGYPTAVSGQADRATSQFGLYLDLPAGDYVVEARGTGCFRMASAGLFGDASLSYHRFDFDGAPASYTITSPSGKKPGEIVHLDIIKSDPADPLRDVHVYSPDRVEGDPYVPAYLDELAPFGVIRFMACQDIIGATRSTWADELGGSGSFCASGEPGFWRARECAELCNRAGKHMWICIPQEATPEYAAALAAEVDEHLDDRLDVYAEYSDETWNWAAGYTAYTYLRDCCIAYNATPAGQAAPMTLKQYMGMRSIEALMAFRAALRPSRHCIRVAASQDGGAEAWLPVVQYMQDNGGIDMIALSVYFKPAMTSTDWDAAVARYSTDPDGAVTALLDLCPDGIDLAVSGIKEWADYAATIGVPVAAYECGAMISASKPDRLPLASACSRHPRMLSELYPKLVAGMQSAGISLAMWFQDTGYYAGNSCYGHREYTGQPDADAPKGAAIRAAALGTLPLPVDPVPA